MGGRFSGNRISLQILPMQEHSGTLSLVALTLLGGGGGEGHGAPVLKAVSLFHPDPI